MIFIRGFMCVKGTGTVPLYMYNMCNMYNMYTLYMYNTLHVYNIVLTAPLHLDLIIVILSFARQSVWLCKKLNWVFCFIHYTMISSIWNSFKTLFCLSWVIKALIYSLFLWMDSRIIFDTYGVLFVTYYSRFFIYISSHTISLSPFTKGVKRGIEKLSYLPN